MTYTGEFKNIDDLGYKIEITNETEGQTVELTLGENPVTLLLDNSDDLIFKPYKGSNCTINLVSSEYYFDLYSKRAHDNLVKIKDSTGNIIWIGYTSPNLYSQGFTNIYEEIQVECIDGISTLKYFDYDSEDKGIISFHDLITKIVNKCGCYSGFYFQLCSSVGENLDNDLLKKLSVSEQDFFDEDGEPMTYEEVLENLCLFLGVTAQAKGDKVYFIDIPSVGCKLTQFINEDATRVTLSINEKQIQLQDYAGEDHEISLADVYNKSVVKDSLYKIDSLIPDIYEKENFYSFTQTTTSGSNPPISYYYKNNYWITVFSEGESDNIGQDDDSDNKYNCYINFLSNPNVKTFWYLPAAEDITNLVDPHKVSYVRNWGFIPTTQPTALNPQNLLGYVCGTFIDYAKQKFYSCDDTDNLGSSTSLVLYLNNKCDNANCNNVPLVQLEYDTKTYILSTEQAKNGVVISANVEFINCNNANTPSVNKEYSSLFWRYRNSHYSVPDDLITASNVLFFKPDFDDLNGHMNKEDLYLLTSIKYGGRYYNDEGEWQDDFCYFKLWLSNGNEKELFEEQDTVTLKDWFGNTYEEFKHIYNAETKGKQFDVKNTVQWYWHINEKGCLITFPDELKELDSKFEFTIYTRNHTYFYNERWLPSKYWSEGKVYRRHQRTAAIWINDLKFIPVVYDKSLENKDNFDIERMKNADQSLDSDTQYSNIIDETFVNKADETEFKICTWDNKALNYSCVYYKDGNNICYLDTLKNHATGQTLRQEEHYIYKVVSQYSTPSKILELEVHGFFSPLQLFKVNEFPDTIFILDGQNYDIKTDVNKIRIVEYKI